MKICSILQNRRAVNNCHGNTSGFITATCHMPTKIMKTSFFFFKYGKELESIGLLTIKVFCSTNQKDTHLFRAYTHVPRRMLAHRRCNQQHPGLEPSQHSNDDEWTSKSTLRVPSSTRRRHIIHASCRRLHSINLGFSRSTSGRKKKNLTTLRKSEMSFSRTAFSTFRS